jgi:hypothetical protein
MRQYHIVAVTAVLFMLGSHAAIAGKTLDHVGKLVCATDKWDE